MLKPILAVLLVATSLLAFDVTHSKNNSPNEDPALIDVQFYHLKLEVALDSQYLKGEVQCKFKAIKPVWSFSLDFADGYKVKGVQGASSFSYRNNKLLINLAAPLSSQALGSVTIQYEGKPPTASEGQVTKGMIYEKHGAKKNEPVIVTLSTPFLAHYWYPCVDGPSDKADSVYVDITVKDTLINNIPVMGVSNGLLTDSLFAGGKRTYMWKHRYPIVPFYVLAAVSNYRRVVTPYEDPLGNKFPLEFYLFDEHMKDADAVMKRLPEIMSTLTSYFGPYPFRKEKYGMTQMGFYSGIETQTNSILRDFKGTSMSTVVHELAHQWFGDAITCASWHDAWLHEGFATYSEALWQEYKRGPEEYQNLIRRNNWFEAGTLHLDDVTNPFQVFKTIVYNKGAMVVHMLRHVMADNYFYDMLKKLPQDPRYKYKNLTAKDIQVFCEKTCGDDLNYFFQEWVYGEWYPSYDFTWKYDEVRKKVVATVNQTKRATKPSFFIMPLDIKMDFGTGSAQTVKVFNDMANQVFEIDAETLPLEVRLDPDNWVMKELRFTRQILNPKTPLELRSFDAGAIGRKITIQFFSDKPQDIVVELTNDKGETPFSKTITKLQGEHTQMLDIPDGSVPDGAYSLNIVGKSDLYKIACKLK